MLKKLIIIFLADIVLLTLLVIWINADPSVAIAEVIIIPTLVIINIIIGFFLLKAKHKETANAFFINCILTACIFHFLFGLWFQYYDKVHFDNSFFRNDNKDYELTIYKKSDYFSLSDITNKRNGFTWGILFGHYKINNDTILLVDSSKRLTLYKNMLVGFPKQMDTIILKH